MHSWMQHMHLGKMCIAEDLDLHFWCYMLAERYKFDASVVHTCRSAD